MRRFRELPPHNNTRILATTNIQAAEAYMTLDYYSLLNSSKTVKDNAGLMAIQMMINMGCKEIWLAGYDGYEYIAQNNYETSDMTLIMSKCQIENINEGMKQVLKEFSRLIDLYFLTDSLFK